MPSPLLADAVEGVGWRPGIGDPTLLGWVTVAAYVVAMLACARAAWIRRDGRAFWVAFAAVMAGLGINKQLDLQTLLVMLGRGLAKRDGWYADRHQYQLAFVAIVGIAALASLVAAVCMARGAWRERLPALLGVVLLLGFIVARAALFSHVSTWGGVLKGGAALELGGIFLIGYSAYRVASRRRGRASASRPGASSGRGS